MRFFPGVIAKQIYINGNLSWNPCHRAALHSLFGALAIAIYLTPIETHAKSIAA